MGPSLKPIQIEQKELDAQQNLDDLLVGGVGSVIWVERQSALSTEEKKVKIMALNTINFFFFSFILLKISDVYVNLSGELTCFSVYLF